MLSASSLRPMHSASSLTKSLMSPRAGVVGSSSSPSNERAASKQRRSIAISAVAAKTSTSSSSSRSRRSVVTSAAAPNNKNKTSAKNVKNVPVDYGRDWFAATRDPSRGMTPRQEMAMRREANRAANNGLERKDLYTDAWAGSEYRGSSNNIVS
jgi:hypothetical protein